MSSSSSGGADRATTAKTTSFADDVLMRERSQDMVSSAASTRKTPVPSSSSASGARATFADDHDNLEKSSSEKLPTASKSSLAWKLYRNKKAGVPVDKAASNDARTLSLPEEDFPVPKNVMARLKKNSTHKHYSRTESRPWYRLRSMTSAPMASKSLDLPLKWYGEIKKEIHLDFSGGKEESKLSLTKEFSSVWHDSSVTEKQRRKVNELFDNSVRKKSAEYIDSAFTSDTYEFQRRIVPSKELVSDTLQRRKSEQGIAQERTSARGNINTWTLKSDFTRRQQSATTQSSSGTSRPETTSTPGRSSDRATIERNNEHRLRDPNVNPFAWSHARSVIDLWDICLHDENYRQIGIRSSTDEGSAPAGSGASSSGGGSTVMHSSTAQLNDFPKASLNVRVNEVPNVTSSSTDGQPQIEVRSEEVQSKVLSLVADHRFKLAMVAVDFDDESGTGHNIARALGADEELFQGAVAAKTSVQADNQQTSDGKKKAKQSGSKRKPVSRSGVKIKNKPKTPDYQKYSSGDEKSTSRMLHRTDILKAMRKQQDQLESRKKLAEDIEQKATDYWKRYLERFQRKDKRLPSEVDSFFSELLGKSWTSATDANLKRKNLLSQEEMKFVKCLTYSRDNESLSKMVHEAETLLERYYEYGESIHPIANTKHEWYTARSALMNLKIDFQFISAKVYLSEFESPLNTKYRLSRILQAKYSLLDHPLRIFSMLVLHRVLEKRIYAVVKRLREKIDQWQKSRVLSEGSLHSQVASKIRTAIYDTISSTKLDSVYQAIIARAVSVSRALYRGDSMSSALAFNRESAEDVVEETPPEPTSEEKSSNQLGILHVWAYANIDEELDIIEELDKGSSFETFTAWQIQASTQANKKTTPKEDSFSDVEARTVQQLGRQNEPKPKRAKRTSKFDNKPWREQPTYTKKMGAASSTVLRSTRSACTVSKATQLDDEASRFLKNLTLSKHLLHTKDEETVKTATDIAAAWYYSLRPQAFRKLPGSNKSKSEKTVFETRKRSGLLSSTDSSRGFYSTTVTQSDEAMRDFIPRQHWSVESPYVGAPSTVKGKQQSKQGASRTQEATTEQTRATPEQPSESLDQSLDRFNRTLERASSGLNATLPSVHEVHRQWSAGSGGTSASSSKWTNRRSAEHAFTQALQEAKREAPEASEKSDDRGYYQTSTIEHSGREESEKELPAKVGLHEPLSHRSTSFPSFESVENIDEPVEIQSSVGRRNRSRDRHGATPGDNQGSVREDMGESRTEVSQQLADVVSKLTIPPRVFNKLLNLIKDDMGMEQSVELSEEAADLKQESTSSSLKSLLTVRDWKELLWSVEACGATINALDMALEETGKMIENSQEFSANRNPAEFINLRSKEIPSDLLPQRFLQDLRDRGLMYKEPPQTLLPPKSEVMNVLQLPKREEDVDELLDTLSKGISSKASEDVLAQTKQSPLEAKIDQMFHNAADALQRLRNQRENLGGRCRDVRLQRQWFEIEFFLREVAKVLVNYAHSKYEGIVDIVGEENAKEIYHKDMDLSCKDVIDHLNSLLEMRETKYQVFLRATAPTSYHRMKHGGEGQEEGIADTAPQDATMAADGSPSNTTTVGYNQSEDEPPREEV
eukprot:gb/GECG01009461.1/.p1 GENE.gb/GECG01009461.1/~~gb/GECG01009461.1/.p1  ORF type:complete len:1607 (+),score=267.20 gb/GECG01009461.1/:1-4821(+)